MAIGLGSAVGCSSSPTKPKDAGSGGSTGTGGVTGSGGSGGGSGGATGGSGGGNADAGSGGTDGARPDGPGGDGPAGADAAIDVPASDGGRGPMTFFVTGMINAAFGGALGGLDGADMRCQRIAGNLPGGTARTWRAYLSTSASGGQPAVNARDRIGTGPWHNARGVLIAANVTALHTPAMNMINGANGTNEWGDPSTGVGDHEDIVTGSTADGMALPESENATCMNWTHGGLDSKARVGHRDRKGDGPDGTSFNSAHTSTNCSALEGPAGVGSARLYCFAIN